MTSSQQAPIEGPTILVAGGGSAGHVSPMLATARALRERYPHARIVALGTKDGLEATLVPAAGFELLTINKVPFPRRPNAKMFTFPGAFAASIRTVRGYLKQYSVDAVVGFGGYVCPPAYLAGVAAGVALIIHEANKRPGMANKLGARFAKHVGTAFPADSGRSLPGATWVGMPMRPEIASLDRKESARSAREALGLDPDRPTLLVTGGSLGAVHLNSVLVEALPELEKRGVQVLHITGRGKQVEAEGALYHQVEYVNAMEDAYAAADFAVTRSGAGTVCELAAVGLPALYVPLPIGNGEQALNGSDVVAAGGARMVADASLAPAVLIQHVDECLLDASVLEQMSAAAACFGKIDAADSMVDFIASVVPALDAARDAHDSTELAKGDAR